MMRDQTLASGINLHETVWLTMPQAGVFRWVYFSNAFFAVVHGKPHNMEKKRDLTLLVDLRLCRWRLCTSSPWYSSSSLPFSPSAPEARNTLAWPSPRSTDIANTFQKKSQANLHPLHLYNYSKQSITKQAPPTSSDIMTWGHASKCLHQNIVQTSPIIHEFEDLALRMRWNSSDWMYSSCSSLFFWAGSSSSPGEFSSVDGYLEK